MNIRKLTQSVALLTVVLTPTAAHADCIEELSSVGNAGRVYDAAGVFVPVFDQDGNQTSEQVFLLHGGYPAEIDAEPVSEVWVLAGGTWQYMGDEAPAMAGHALLAAADGRAWAIGAIGHDGWLRPMTTLPTFEVRRIDGRLEVFVGSVQVPGPAPRSCFGAAAVTADGGRSLLSVGGSCLGNPLDQGPAELWEYRIETNRWERLADLPVRLSNHSAVTARDFVWVFGGSDADGVSDDVYRYDLLTDRWLRVDVKGDRPAPRHKHRAVAASNAMVVFGGVDGDFFPETMSDVWQLDLDTLTWIEKRSMSGGLAQMALDLVPRRLLSGRSAQVLIYGGATDVWSFPYDVSDGTSVYTSDINASRARSYAIADSPAIR